MERPSAIPALLVVLAVTTLLATPPRAAAGRGTRHSFAFGAVRIAAGAPGRELMLTGGGEFDRAWGYLRAGGGFRCTRDIARGPLSGCRTGEGILWEATEFLPASGARITGSSAGRIAWGGTDDETIVMRTRFYRRGDGAHASFFATMIVSARDGDPATPGIQNVWVEGVGCGTADLLFN